MMRLKNSQESNGCSNIKPLYKTSKIMKAKTQVIISLCIAVFLMVYYIINICYQWPLRLSRTWTLSIFIIPFVVLTTYIISMIRKDLKTVKITFGIWQIFAVVALFFIIIIMDLQLIAAGLIDNMEVYKVLLMIFLNCAITYGLSTLIIWMGLRGFKQIIEAENKSKIENIEQTNGK